MQNIAHVFPRRPLPMTAALCRAVRQLLSPVLINAILPDIAQNFQFDP